MPLSIPMKTKAAAFISFIGHPLLTIPIFAIIAFFTYEEFQRALWHSSLIVAGIFLPLSIRMYLKARRGAYTNFDVSDKKQRQSWYVFAVVLLAGITVVLFITDQPRTLRLSLLFSSILLALSQVLNYFVKSSLHVSFTIFLSFMILPMNPVAAAVFLAFTLLIAWARLTLKRHTWAEIITGAGIGLAIGITYFFCI
jgi:hypothetical protein